MISPLAVLGEDLLGLERSGIIDPDEIIMHVRIFCSLVQSIEGILDELVHCIVIFGIFPICSVEHNFQTISYDRMAEREHGFHSRLMPLPFGSWISMGSPPAAFAASIIPRENVWYVFVTLRPLTDLSAGVAAIASNKVVLIKRTASALDLSEVDENNCLEISKKL